MEGKDASTSLADDLKELNLERPVTKALKVNLHGMLRFLSRLLYAQTLKKGSLQYVAVKFPSFSNLKNSVSSRFSRNIQ